MRFSWALISASEAFSGSDQAVPDGGKTIVLTLQSQHEEVTVLSATQDFLRFTEALK